jgi:hypothetical protein
VKPLDLHLFVHLFTWAGKPCPAFDKFDLGYSFAGISTAYFLD